MPQSGRLWLGRTNGIALLVRRGRGALCDVLLAERWKAVRSGGGGRGEVDQGDEVRWLAFVPPPKSMTPRRSRAAILAAVQDQRRRTLNAYAYAHHGWRYRRGDAKGYRLRHRDGGGKEFSYRCHGIQGSARSR